MNTLFVFRQDATECVTNVPHLFILLVTLWLSGKPEVVSATTLTMRALIEEVIGPASEQPQHRLSVTKVIVTIQAGLAYQYHAAWTQVLHIFGVIFKVSYMVNFDKTRIITYLM